jgi:hypothetical protein
MFLAFLSILATLLSSALKTKPVQTRIGIYEPPPSCFDLLFEAIGKNIFIFVILPYSLISFFDFNFMTVAKFSNFQMVNNLVDYPLIMIIWAFGGEKAEFAFAYSYLPKLVYFHFLFNLGWCFALTLKARQ